MQMVLEAGSRKLSSPSRTGQSRNAYEKRCWFSQHPRQWILKDHCAINPLFLWV